MPSAFSRSLETLELDTAAFTWCFTALSASMKKFTVEPVPTPSTVPGTRCLSASCATFALASSCGLAIGNQPSSRVEAVECEHQRDGGSCPLCSQTRTQGDLL